MKQKEYSLPYPRRRLIRAVVKIMGRVILRFFFRVRINGKENFPDKGPLIVVGNHVAVIEAALMAVFTPWQVELLGAGDMPQEPFVEAVEWLYDYIPIDRGSVDRAALRKALDILKQGGMLGLFPEGGLWEPGAMRAQTGVAWLSYRGKAPVLPIAYVGTMGALNTALKFKRPRLAINVGEVIPAAELPKNQGRKPYLQSYANRVMQEVKDLLPPDDPSLRPKIREEGFELEITVRDQDGISQLVPPELAIKHPQALAKFLHRPTILKIFRVNFKLPIDPVQNLHKEPSTSEISRSLELILEALEGEYPYLLTYRFGPQQAEKMQHGLTELLALAQWADEAGFGIRVKPVRRYTSTETGEVVVQVEQGTFEDWM